MPAFGPIRRDRLLYYLRQLGFTGPYRGAKHQFMEGRGVRVRIPNPHRADISRDLLAEILRQARISREEWEAL